MGASSPPAPSPDAVWSDDMPEVYDRALGPALFAPCSERVAAHVAALRPQRVLELAAGTGQLTRRLLEALPDAEVVATDLNAAMVDWAAARVPGATWRQADAQRLVGVADAAHDLVVCQFGAMFFPDRPAAYAEVLRVLEPGGAFVVVVWDALERATFESAMAAALAEVLPDRTPDFLARLPHGMADAGLVRAELEAAGFTVEGVEPLRVQGSAPSATTLAEGFCLGTPLRSALAERGDLTALRSALAERLTARLGEGPLVGDLAAHVATARRPVRG